MEKAKNQVSPETPRFWDDITAMMAALAEAEKAFATPNPNVGCVLIKNDECVGKGHTQPVGGAHAEVMALREAGENARGATAYVTLEPCSHFGRTPPCADALISAGVEKVVIAVLDNNPRVSGNGVKRLRGAGTAVEIGPLEEQAKKINEDFFHFHQTQTPFVTLKAATTLDGKIATASGASKWITETLARQYVHTLRAKSGAVLVGIGTLLKDNAQLTAREAEMSSPFPRQPLRIVLDSRLRTPPDCAALRIAEANPLTHPLLIATTETASPENENALKRDGVEIVRLPPNAAGHVSLPHLLKTLGGRNVISLLVEGGGEVYTAFLREKLAHKAAFFIAPKLLGGKDSLTAFGGENPHDMTDALTLKAVQTTLRYAPDILLTGYLPE